MSYDKNTACKKCGGQHAPFFEDCKRKDVMAKAEKESPPIAHARATPHAEERKQQHYRMSASGDLERVEIDTKDTQILQFQSSLDAAKKELEDRVLLKRKITSLEAERDTLRGLLGEAERAMRDTIARADDYGDSGLSRPVRDFITKLRSAGEGKGGENV